MLLLAYLCVLVWHHTTLTGCRVVDRPKPKVLFTHAESLPRNTKQVTLRAFTGAASVEAFVNGVSLGKQTVAKYQVASWPNVPFAKGKISAIAYDENNKTVATSEVATTGAADSIRVTVVDISDRPYAADGLDVALFEVAIVDSKGVVVPDFCGDLT